MYAELSKEKRLEADRLGDKDREKFLNREMHKLDENGELDNLYKDLNPDLKKKIDSLPENKKKDKLKQILLEK